MELIQFSDNTAQLGKTMLHLSITILSFVCLHKKKKNNNNNLDAVHCSFFKAKFLGMYLSV